MTSWQWAEMVDFFADQLGMDAAERDLLERNVVARLVAVLPHLAESHNAERTSYAHLATFITAARAPQVFGHQLGETIRDRLLEVSHFAGGKPQVIRRGMLLLELASLVDHMNDALEDAAKGKRNPIVDGLDFEGERARLLAEIEAVPCPAMDEILDVDTTIRLGWWWPRVETRTVRSQLSA